MVFHSHALCLNAATSDEVILICAKLHSVFKRLSFFFICFRKAVYCTVQHTSIRCRNSRRTSFSCSPFLPLRMSLLSETVHQKTFHHKTFHHATTCHPDLLKRRRPHWRSQCTIARMASPTSFQPLRFFRIKASAISHLPAVLPPENLM